MTREQAAAYVYAQAVCALAEVEAMKIANMECHWKGQTPPFGEQQFRDVILRNGIHHNAVIGLYRESA